MRDELTSRLKAALDREQAPGSPDLGWVLARGHRLRVRRLISVAMSAVVISATITTVIAVLPSADDARSLVAGDPSAPPHESISPQAPSEGEVVEEIPEQQRAEVFAFRALADTGLMDPFGKRSYFFTDSDGTTQTSNGWRVGFAAGDFAHRGNSFGCHGLSGEDPDTGNTLADTFAVVELNQGAWRVIDVEGNILDEERDRVVGYQLPDHFEPSHWEVPAVSLLSPDEGLSVTMLPLWVGPYPTNARAASARSSQGMVKARRSAMAQSSITSRHSENSSEPGWSTLEAPGAGKEPRTFRSSVASTQASAGRSRPAPRSWGARAWSRASPSSSCGAARRDSRPPHSAARHW